MAEVSEEDGLPKFIDPRSMEEVWAQKSAHTAELLSKHLKDVEVDLVPSPVVKWRQRCRFAIEVTEPQHPEAGSAVASVRPAGVAAGGGRAELWVLPDKDGIVRAPLHAFTRGKSGNAAVAAVAAVAAGAEASTPAQVRMKTLEGNAQVRLVITQREPRSSNMNGAGAAVTGTGGDAGVIGSANGSGNGSGGAGTDVDEMDDVPAGDGDVDGDESNYIKPCYVDNGFPIASEACSSAMVKLRQQLALSWAAPLRGGLCTCNFHGTMKGASGDMVVSLFYNRPRSLAWMAAAERLRAETGFTGVVGRSKGSRSVSGRDYVVETLAMSDGRTLQYRQLEGHFSNPNSHIAALTLDWLCGKSKQLVAASLGQEEGHPPTSDLLEMYCGNGNHTMALASCGAFRKVLGIEINSKLVEMAQENIKMNGVGGNCMIKRAPSGKFVTKVLRKPKALHPAHAAKLKAMQQEQRHGIGTGTIPGGHVAYGQDYDFKTCLVDPPRAGLDDPTIRHLRRYKNIMYISCNPRALARDLEKLSSTHRVAACALFDHFPRTLHLETAVHLTAVDGWEPPTD